MSKAFILIILVIAVAVQVYGMMNVRINKKVPSPSPTTAATLKPFPFPFPSAFGRKRVQDQDVPTVSPTSSVAPTSSSPPSPLTSSPSPSSSPSDGPIIPALMVTFKSIATPERLLQLSLDAKRVVMDGLEGAVLYYQHTGEESFDVYFYVNGKLYEFKYENSPQVGVLIQKHRDYDTICVYKLVN